MSENIKITGGTGKGGLTNVTPQSGVLLDEKTNSSILANMEKLASEINSPWRKFNENLKDMTAWTQYNKGPAFALREEAANTDRNTLYNIRQQQAAYQEAQLQAQAEAENIARFKQGIPGGGGAGGTGSAGGVGGPNMAQQQLLSALGNVRFNQVGAQRALIDEYNKQQLKGSSEAMYNPAANKQENYFIPGVGDVGMTPNENITLPADVKQNINQRLLDRLRGNTPTVGAPTVGAPTVGAPTAPTTTGGNPPVSVRQNNPGNLVDPKTNQIRTFATPQEGDAALTQDLGLKISGQSPIVKERFGPQVGNFMSPALLAETWAPSTAKGNTPESTQNYGKAIADSLGMSDVTAQIPNTPEALAKAKAAIIKFEAGPGANAPSAAAKPPAVTKPPPPPIGMPDAAVAVISQIPQFNEPKPIRASFNSKPEADSAVANWEKRRDAALDIYKNYEEKAGAASVEAFKEAEKNFVNLTDDRKLGARQTSLNSLNGWVNKWGDNDRVVGLLSKPTLGNAIASAIQTGISTPVGSIGIPEIEGLVQAGMPGLKTEERQALKQLTAIMGPRILQIVEQTKGSSSDKDWAAYQNIAGGASNGYDFLKKAVEYDKVSLKADREDRALYNRYNQGNQRTDYRGFAANPERSSIYDEYNKETDRIANTTYAFKKAPPKPAGMPTNVPAEWSESTQSYWIGNKQYKVSQ